MKTLLKWFTTKFLYKIAKLMIAELKNRYTGNNTVTTNNLNLNIQAAGLSGIQVKALQCELEVKNALPKHSDFTQDFVLGELKLPEYNLTIWLDQDNFDLLAEKVINIR